MAIGVVLLKGDYEQWSRTKGEISEARPIVWTRKYDTPTKTTRANFSPLSIERKEASK